MLLCGTKLKQDPPVLLDPAAAVLLVTKRSQILANRIKARPPQLVPVASGSSIVTVDFDRQTSRIYWADASQKKIWSAYQNGTDRREVSEMIILYRFIKLKERDTLKITCL